MKPFFFACRAAAARRALATGFVVGLALCGALAPQGAQGYERHILSISGTPANTALAGQTYSFTPSAHDARDRTLIFAIANKPAWATFSASSGQLSGTPSAADVGAYADIVIAVSDGRRTATLPAFTLQVNAAAAAPPPTATATATATAADRHRRRHRHRRRRRRRRHRHRRRRRRRHRRSSPARRPRA